MKQVKQFGLRKFGLFVLLMATVIFSCQKSEEKISEMSKEAETWKQIQEASKQEVSPYIPELSEKFLVRPEWPEGGQHVLDWIFQSPDINRHYSKGLYFILYYDKSGRYFLKLQEKNEEIDMENQRWNKICSGGTREVLTCALNWLEAHKKCEVRIYNDPVDGATAYGCCEEC